MLGTDFGGDMYLRMEGTAGVLNYDWADFNVVGTDETNLDYRYSPVLWTGTLGLGVKIKSRFNILLRGGVGSTFTEDVVPLFCLDMGSFQF